MRLIHLSDLHLGKRIFNYSLIEDQTYLLQEIIQKIRQVMPVDGVLLAGDIYDKTMPSADAVRLFDDFLTELSWTVPSVFVISGNHDCQERISYGGRLMEKQGIYLAPRYEGNVSSVALTDDYGSCRIWMLPFLRLSAIRAAFPEEELPSMAEGMRSVVGHMNLKSGERNILMAHQFVAGAIRSESEEISVGGLDGIPADIFDEFDYTALGHIHRAQQFGQNIRYCGTPLKYSFDEAGQTKSMTLVTLEEKGRLQVEEIPLVPLTDMREEKGSFEDLIKKGLEGGADNLAYLHVTLTDEEDVMDAAGKLRRYYPNLMKLDYDNLRTRSITGITGEPETVMPSPAELFETLYRKQNNQTFNEKQKAYLEKLMVQLSEDTI